MTEPQVEEQRAEIRYRGDLVCVVRRVFESDGTWYGADCALTPRPEVRTEAWDFVAFCREWHGRLDEAPDSPPDSGELMRFGTVVDDDEWSVVLPDRVLHLLGAPVFAGDEVSWCVRQQTNVRRP